MGTIYSFHNESAIDTLAVDDELLVYDTSAGGPKTVTGAQVQDGVVTSGTTAGGTLTNTGHTVLTATAATDFTLPAPVAGRIKTITCQSTSANTVTCTTATAVTLQSAMHKITFGSTGVDASQSVILRGVNALRWDIIGGYGATLTTT